MIKASASPPIIANAIHQPPLAPQNQGSKWVKFIRILFWLVAVSLICIGLALKESARQSDSYAYGYSMALSDNGAIFFTVGIILAGANAFWGAARWILRCDREQWRASRIIGKLIGGGIWRLIVFSLLILINLFFVAPKVKGLIISRVIDEASTLSPIAVIEQDYQDGKITVDDYMNYLIDAAYSYQSLPTEYQFNQPIIVPDIIGQLNANLESLSPATLQRAFELLSFSNIDFGSDASGNLSAESTLFSNNAYASSNDVKVLNKAVQSASGNFLVFYTDTGDDKISEEAARRIGEMMETLIVGYQDAFGLSYHTEQISFHAGIFNSKRNAMKEVLRSNNINDTLLDTAMPIYVVNPFYASSNVLATYAGRRWADTLERLALRLADIFGSGNSDTDALSDLYTSSPVLPFIHILPENINDESLELVVAHEFGHHYASNYCYDNFGVKCASDEDFIGETLPNYTASVVVKNQPANNLIAYHHNVYIARTDIAINQAGESKGMAGYPALAFLDNYAEIVEDGQTKIFNALMQQDAYSYLYEQAGSDAMARVLSSLAVKNITNDYGNRLALYADRLPGGSHFSCTDFCTMRYGHEERPLAASSINYFYFPSNEYANKLVKVTDYTKSSTYTFDILGLRDGNWIPLVLAPDGNSFEINFQTTYADYDTILLAVANYAPDNRSNDGFSISISDLSLPDVVIEDDEPSEEFFGQYGNCIWMHTDGIISAAQQIIGVFRGIDDRLDASIANWNAQAEDAKTQVGHRKITICGRTISHEADFDAIKASLSHGMHVTLFDSYEQSISHRMGIVANFYPLRNTVQAHLLIKDSQSFSLVTATIE